MIHGKSPDFSAWLTPGHSMASVKLIQVENNSSLCHERERDPWQCVKTARQHHELQLVFIGNVTVGHYLSS